MKRNYSLSFLLIFFMLLTPKVFAQYCIPDFKTHGCTYGDLIDDFIIKDSAGNIVFSHLGTGCSSNAYGDFTLDPNLLVNLEANKNYELEVTTQASSMLVQIWIDFNGNENFEDSGEKIFESSVSNNYGDPVVGAFNITDFEGIAETRMRVKIYFNQGTSNSCSQSNNFGGEAHDYSVVVTGEVQDCASPTDLSVTQTGVSEVTFNWDNVPEAVNGYSWYLMNYEEHPDYSNAIDSGVVAVGSDSLVLSSIPSNINYELFIKSECDAGVNSIWRSIPFYIVGDGGNCEKPLPISSLPFSHSDTTFNYLNLINDVSNCSKYAGYLNGYEVVYHYYASEDQVLNVSLEDLNGFNSAVLVYEDCSDIGVNCPIDGSVTQKAYYSHVLELIVEHGKDYYFVISSASPTDSFEYILDIDGYGCTDVPMPEGETIPYFLVDSFLSSLEIQGSKFNDGFTWYSDSSLNQEIKNPNTELLVEGNTYYVTQNVLGCQGGALAISPLEFTCGVLSPNLITDKIDLCIPGGEVILKALTSVAGEQIYWYESEIADTALAEGVELDVGFISSTTSYWVTEGRFDMDGQLLCESDKVEIIIDVSKDSPEAPNVDPSYTFCGDDTYTLRDIPIEGQMIQWFDSFGKSLDLETELEDGTMYHVVEMVNTCISQIADVVVYLKDYSDKPVAEIEQTFEEGEVLLTLEVDGQNLRWYADIEMEYLLPITTSLEDNKAYYVTQTQENLCESMPLEITVTKILGTDSLVFNELEYWPNPVVDILHLRNKEIIHSIELYDLSGKKIHVQVNNGNEADVIFSYLNAGMYFVKIKSANMEKILRIVKK